MKIGIDIDEVIVEFVKGYIRILENKGIKAEYEKTFSCNLWESYSISKEQALEIAEEYYKSEYFNNIEFIEGAKESIETLGKYHEIYFITSRPISLKEKTEEFIEKHFPNSSIILIFSGDLHKANGKSKAEICRENNIQVLIEDSFDYALESANNGIKVILLEKPWNKNSLENEKILRVKNWEEILSNLK